MAGGLAKGRSHIYGALDADDTRAAAQALRDFGVEVHTDTEPWIVVGNGGHLVAPREPVDAGESGLTARLALALAAHADGSTTVTGRGRLLIRPISGVVDSLMSQDVSVETEGGTLPATVHGVGGMWGGDLAVDTALTSQFATAVMLVSPLMSEPAVLRVDEFGPSAGYLDLTAKVMEAFGASVTTTITGFEIDNTGYSPTDYVVEPDASSAAYPLVAAAVTGGLALIEGLTSESLQPDIEVARILAQMGCGVEDRTDGLQIDARGVRLRGVDVDMVTAPDGALAVAVACMFADGPSRIEGLRTLKYKESDRLDALKREMTRLGCRVSVDSDSIEIEPGALSGAELDSHGDHRVAMALAVCGLAIPGVSITHPEVVGKTWPGFWAALGDMARSGVGAKPALGSSPVSPLVITVDGPAGTGKSTVSRKVAELAGLPHLDTGAFYRAATLAAIRSGIDLEDGDRVADIVASSEFDQSDGVMLLNGEDVSREIRGEAVTSHVSLVSSHSKVRNILVGHQRGWIEAHGGRGVVEGRDIGTIVFPDATVKIYLDASPEVRAQRRSEQTGKDLDLVLSDIRRRDSYDSTRETSPLTVPPRSFVVDTTELTFEQVVDEVMGLIPTDN